MGFLFGVGIFVVWDCDIGLVIERHPWLTCATNTVHLKQSHNGFLVDCMSMCMCDIFHGSHEGVCKLMVVVIATVPPALC